MHARLSGIESLRNVALPHGRRLIDVREPPAGLPVASGRKRSGRRLLTVGTDCALGKKYTALALAGEFRARGVDADFRATGQTGILIAGEGIPMDAVVADFAAGAAETLSPDADPAHWDVIEGQARCRTRPMPGCRWRCCTAASRTWWWCATSRGANTCSGIPITGCHRWRRASTWSCASVRGPIRRSAAPA